jgi:hypothetical protein
MLSGVVHNFGAQISRTPCPQRGAQKHKQGASRDHDSRERCGIRAIARYRWRDQVSKCEDERRVIKNREEKSYQINRADDPEPFFELEFTRAHAASVAAAAVRRNPVTSRFVAGGSRSILL